MVYPRHLSLMLACISSWCWGPCGILPRTTPQLCEPSWDDVTAMASQDSDGPPALQTRMTLFSALGYLPRWAKYTLVPDFVRFLWWLVWVRICAVAHIIHRAAVLQGASGYSNLRLQKSNRIMFKGVLSAAHAAGSRGESAVCLFPITCGALRGMCWPRGDLQHGVIALEFAAPVVSALLCHPPQGWKP